MNQPLTSISRFDFSRLASVVWNRLGSDFVLLDLAHDIYQALIDLAKLDFGQGALVFALYVVENNELTVGFVHREARVLFELSDFYGAVGALADQPDELPVDIVDFEPPLRYVHSLQ